MSDIASKDAADRLFIALGEQLAAPHERYELVVIGGSGLLALGLINRLERRNYGDSLSVYLASRYDQIHFKLYALVDQGPGKHEDDLRGPHLGVDDVDLGR